MELSFEKWHGCKNDFLVFWVEKRQDLQINSLAGRAAEFCSRKGAGVGGDGILIIVHDQTKGDFRDLALRIVNSDGSDAKTCGNGIRCAAASVLKRFHARQKAFEELEAIDFTLADRTVTVQFLNPLKANDIFSVPLMAVDMGVAKTNEELSWYSDAKAEVKRVQEQLKTRLQVQDVGVCEIGNQHLVLFCDRIPPEAIYEIGPKLQTSKFWDGINVHLAESVVFQAKEMQRVARILPLNQEEIVKAYVWERGSGPTQACGSGASAIAACAYASGRNERKDWLTIRMPGGDLFVKQEDRDEACLLAGPAAFVFSGKLEL